MNLYSNFSRIIDFVKCSQ